MSATRLCEKTRIYEVMPHYPTQDEEGTDQIEYDVTEVSCESNPYREYVSGLKKTIINAVVTIIASSIIGIISLTSLIYFASTGNSFIHPYIGIFFTFFALGMLILGILSAITTKSYFEKALELMRD